MSTILSSQILLQYGDNHTARISERGEVDEYQFKADSGDIVWIRMRDVSDVDAFIKLYSPTGGMVAHDSDDGGLAFIKDLTLHQTGIYRIEAFDINANDVGDYGISLHLVNGPDYGTNLPCFINFTDEIASTCAINVYSFDGVAGDVLYTQMRGLTEHIEPEYFLYDERGDLIFKSIRSGRMAKYEMTIPTDGRYFLYVMDKGGNDVDQFGFNLQFLNRHDCSHALICGETAEDGFEHMAARNPYVLKMAAGELGILQLRSPDPSVESSFSIYNDEGQMVLSKSGSDKMVETMLEATEDASYLIVAYDKHGNDLGPYGMHYESITHNPCAEEILCASENYFEHELTAVAQLKSYLINGHKDEPFKFHLREKDQPLEPYLRVCDEAGEMIVDKYGSIKVEASGTFPEDGAYYILVGDRSGNDLGKYTLQSEASESFVKLPDMITVTGTEPCVLVEPEVTGLPTSYVWSTGSTDPMLEICPEETVELILEVSFANGCVASASTLVVVEKPSCDTINFNHFPTGAVPGTQLEFVNISAVSNHKQGTNLAAVFNSTDPPKHSEGLGTPHKDFGGAGVGGGGVKGHRGENAYHQKQVLVIADNDVDKDGDGLLDNPVDDPKGGFFRFEFAQAVDISSVLVIDQHQEGGHARAYDPSDRLIGTYHFETLGNNSVETVILNAVGVQRLEVEFIKWGALDDIVYCKSHILAEPLPCEVLDFNDLVTGQIPSDYRDIVSISALNNQGPDVATIFGSTNPPIHCADLGTPHQDFGGHGLGKGGAKGEMGENNNYQDKILIIAENVTDQNEDGMLDFPEDDADGGKLVLDFKQLVNVESILVIDQEKQGGYVQAFGHDGKSIKKIKIKAYGDNSVQKIALDATSVKKMVIKLVGSGAIDDIKYCHSFPAVPAADAADNRTLSGVGSGKVAVDQHKKIRVEIYPNPANQILNIDLAEAFTENTSINIIDLSGKLVWEQKIMDAQSVIRVAQFRPGTYFLKIMSDQQVETRRFLVAH